MTKNAQLELVKAEEMEDKIKTKKDAILSLYKSGTTEIEAIATVSGAKPSYVGSVLQKEGLIDNYFDLYTSTAHPMNVYSKEFRGKLGFKDVTTAKRSVRELENSYRKFSNRQDRAGQHHALEMALTMLDRARWTGKLEEAEVYRRWLVNKLSAPLAKLADEEQLKEVKTEESAEEKKEQPELKIAA